MGYISWALIGSILDGTNDGALCNAQQQTEDGQVFYYYEPRQLQFAVRNAKVRGHVLDR